MNSDGLTTWFIWRNRNRVQENNWVATDFNPIRVQYNISWSHANWSIVNCDRRWVCAQTFYTLYCQLKDFLCVRQDNTWSSQHKHKCNINEVSRALFFSFFQDCTVIVILFSTNMALIANSIKLLSDKSKGSVVCSKPLSVSSCLRATTLCGSTIPCLALLTLYPTPPYLPYFSKPVNSQSVHL